MAYKIITAATTEPLTLEEARTHLRLVAFGDPLSHPDDDYVEALITSARTWCEQYTGRSFAEQTIEFALDDFPENEIRAPLSPLSSITSIKYVDTNGDEQTASSSLYALDDYNLPNWVLLTSNSVWPTTLGGANNVKVRAVSNGNNVPEPVKSAMKLIIGSLYNNREQDSVNTSRISFNSLPLGVFSLLQPYRINLGV